MSSAVLYLLGITLGLVALGVVEYALHRRNLASLKIRIHVNGTRGKSSVVRLIAASLREAGIVTCAKTTGTLARFIMPNGKEVPVVRAGKPNVIEQTRIVASARELGAEALVIECMALQPYLQWLSEFKLVRATHAVITNARPDHLDVMGPTPVHVARALCGMVPRQGVLLTAERDLLDEMRLCCFDRKAQMICVGSEDEAAISDEEMKGFSYTEHKENVALVLRVCAEVGVDRETALRGMYNAQRDPGAMTEHEIEFFGRRIYFVNGFAANDPVSTERIWQLMVDKYSHAQKRVAIFNCRADRQDRTLQLSEAYMHWTPADHVVLMGDGTYLFARSAVAAGLDASRLVTLENKRVEEIFEHIVDLVGDSAMVMGLGNIGGGGLDLVRYFANRSLERRVHA